MGPDAMKPEPPNSDSPEIPQLGPEAERDLTRSILSQTSGSPCLRLHAQACAFVDGDLEEDRCGLLRSHLTHCPSCAALVATLSEAKVVLPALAELSPGPWFTRSVLRATVHAPRPSVHPADDPWTSWMKLIHRPRICLEAAYLSAAAGILGIYSPMPNLPWASGMVPSILRGLSPKPVLEHMEAPARRIVEGLVQAERRTATSLRRPFQAQSATLGASGAHPFAPSVPTAARNPRPGAWNWVSFRFQRWFAKHPRPTEVEPKDGNPRIPANP